jgi:hypothetical protein
METVVELFALAETIPADRVPADRISGYRNYVGDLINNLAS